MISTRILVRTCRCACYNSIKNGLQINSHKSQISSPILQRIPLHLPVVSCSTNIIKTEEKKTTQETKAFKDISFFRKIKHTLGFDRDLRVSYKKLELSAYRSWLCITELVDHDAFCEILDLPDTFNTWFLINELHLWIILTRLSFEGVEGRYFRNVLVSLMWKDTELRMKEVETVSFNERKEFLDQMKFHLQNAFLFYDEVIIKDEINQVLHICKYSLTNNQLPHDSVYI
ncbi:ubiquinol-cytochrome-c reductase complex assembly factor 1-like [Ylistrum balloti]|uniref:ubiquinol-cytochrome-c reductase complex assembly factor 1-like n=1 Tax=Ylistrum balloti TaxID=509963 RepID=UPI002905EA4F|nr:ubiquinol-cytochrome-c reductase complex assembly factor 1-like [Ylistrum balloti]